MAIAQTEAWNCKKNCNFVALRPTKNVLHLCRLSFIASIFCGYCIFWSAFKDIEIISNKIIIEPTHVQSHIDSDKK